MIELLHLAPGAARALLAGALLAPLALALLMALPPLRAAALRLAPLAALPALALAFAPRTDLAWPHLLLGARLGVDALSGVFLFFTAALWFAAGWFGAHYLAGDAARARYTACWLLAMTGNFALVLAQDIATFYTGFALMSFASYALVLHDGRAESRRAARIYLALAIAGELLQFAAFSLIAARMGDTSLADVPAAVAASPYRGAIVVLLLAGFGIKAGLVPLHVWLPLAHPVAPTPASAVLSGAMIKAGLLGWLRFLPLGTAAWPAAGDALIALGLAGALGAALVGVTQRHPKAVLAYSSISQMGLMIVLAGVALLDVDYAPRAAAAVALYALHHGLAKGALFLGVGMATAAPGGARGRAAVYTGCAFAGLALAGAPMTSGALAKIGLKDAAGLAGGVWENALGLLLSLGAVGTTLLMLRFLVRLRALAAEADGAPHPHRASAAIWLPWLLLLATVAAAAWHAVPGLAEPHRAYALTAATWLKLAWPVASGLALGALALALTRRRTPFAEIPQGDLLVPAARAAGALQTALRASRDAARVRLVDIDRARAGIRIHLRAALLALSRGEFALRAMSIAGVALVALIALLLARLRAG